MSFEPVSHRPRFSAGQFAEGQSQLERIAEAAQAIPDEKLRHLILATAEVRKLEPRLACFEADRRAFAGMVEGFAGAMSEKEPRRVEIAKILSALFLGAAEGVTSGELPFNYALELLNGDSTEQPGRISADDAFSFAVGYGDAGFAADELYQAFTQPHQDLLAEHRSDREACLILLFVHGFEQLGRDGARPPG